jgi:hypothetical protein
MLYARARTRYLAAIGLSTAFAGVGCHKAEPAGSTPATATAQATSTRHTAPWVPAAEATPEVPKPGAAVCPHGPFCMPAASGAAADATCAPSVPLPEGIGPTAQLGSRPPSVSYDAARTTTERASEPGVCCYSWHVLCVGGRALRGPEGPVTAATARRDDWLAPEAAVDASALAPSTRAALAAHWAREAAFEHASVASFARASLALMSVGAPPDLVAAAHAAAIDEIDHARLAYALASAYGAAPHGPGPLAAVPTGETTLARIAAETLIDACAGESVAALALREAASTAEDPAVRAILSRIAADEEQHADLAWRTVAWALGAGGREVARALADAMEALRAEPDTIEPDARPSLAAFGVLDATARREIRRRALAEVVLPCAEALLAAATPLPEEARASV